ncbi:phosphoribosylanthranilate isomerase [Paenibacillus sp. sgz500958]|uniref:phosphoribosylanthranilate isomerase n=1 Tax=Paenibacillus sp. sgz500958 TaxID=3242475 RepID=UPI0036D3090A
MGETKVKICGLQDVEVLKSMVHLPLDYVGFVFAPSRRLVSQEKAAELTAILGEWKTDVLPQAAGVFVNPSMDDLTELLSKVPLQIIQLHGHESPEFCLEVTLAFPKVQVWKALSVADNEKMTGNSYDRIKAYKDTVHALLLDAYDPQQRGGSGRTFAWEEIPAYQAMAAEMGLPLFIAGGLHPGNVGALLEGYAPDGVDVSSGVETDGVKDLAKIAAFVERVKLS